MKLDLDTELALARALARKPADPGFADRVVARLPDAGLAATPVRAPGRAPRRLAWLGLAAGLTVVVVIGGGLLSGRLERERQGELARQQVMTALRITGAKLRVVEREVREIAGDRMEDRREATP